MLDGDMTRREPVYQVGRFDPSKLTDEELKLQVLFQWAQKKEDKAFGDDWLKWLGDKLNLGKVLGGMVGAVAAKGGLGSTGFTLSLKPKAKQAFWNAAADVVGGSKRSLEEEEGDVGRKLAKK